MKKRVRVGTLLAFTGLVLAFVLAWRLEDPTPFTVLAPVAVGGKWLENWQERRTPRPPEPEEEP